MKGYDRQIRGGALRTRDNPRCWHLEIRKDDVANSLTRVEKDSLIVYTPTNLTDTPPQSTATLGETGATAIAPNHALNSLKETYVNKIPRKSPKLTSSPQAFPANLLALLEEDWDWRTPEALSFLMWLGFSETKDPDIFCLKTSKVYFLTTLEKLSRRYLGFSPTSGIVLNGKCLTQRAGFPRIERGYSLSDILEENVDERYFLSEKMMKGLMKGFAEPQVLDASTGEDIQEDITRR